MLHCIDNSNYPLSKTRRRRTLRCTVVCVCHCQFQAHTCLFICIIIIIFVGINLKNYSVPHIQLQDLATCIFVNLQANLIFGVFLFATEIAEIVMSNSPLHKKWPGLLSAQKLFATSIYRGKLAGQNYDNIVKNRVQVQSPQRKIIL